MGCLYIEIKSSTKKIIVVSLIISTHYQDPASNPDSKVRHFFIILFLYNPSSTVYLQKNKIKHKIKGKKKLD